MYVKTLARYLANKICKLKAGSIRENWLRIFLIPIIEKVESIFLSACLQ